LSAPQRPAPPAPTIDPRLLELAGRTYKDRSRPATAQRAAYHQARAARFMASPGSALPAEPSLAVQTAGIGDHYAGFFNFGTSPDWTPESGNQEPGGEGWIMHSIGAAPPTGSSRMRFNYPINDGSSPYTVVQVKLRGGPDNGKNSYVTLIEQSCADSSGACTADSPNNCCDEIDLVEYYGQPSALRGEFTIHQNGVFDQVGTMVWPTPADPGHNQFIYYVYLEPGNYMRWVLWDTNFTLLGQWERYSRDAYVPSQPMNVYIGIWDIGSIGINVDPPGFFPGDSWMAVSWTHIVAP
jgi:hypothetical protein